MDELDTFCGSRFWDVNVTWNTEHPDFTQCFEKTVLVWIPCGFIWLAAVFEICNAVKSKNGFQIPNTILNTLQRLIVLILLVLEIVQFSSSYRTSSTHGEEDEELEIHTVDRVAPVIKGGTFCLVVALQTFNQRKGIRNSGVFFIFWLLSALCGFFEFQTTLRNLAGIDDDEHEKFRFIILMITYPLVVLEFILTFPPDNPSGVCQKSSAKINLGYDGNTSNGVNGKSDTNISKNPCPELIASFPSILAYSWFGKIACLGFKKPLEYHDLWDLNAGDKSKPLIEKFSKFWKPALINSKKLNSVKKEFVKNDKKLYSVEEFLNNNTSPKLENSELSAETEEEKRSSSSEKASEKSIASILPALIKANWGVFLSGSLLKLVQDLLGFVSPQILDSLIRHVSSGEENWKGYLYAILLLVTSMTQTVFLGQYFHRMFLIGMRIRSALVGTIYQKSLIISNSARKEFTLGEIVNLMSVDCQRFVDLTVYLNMIWSAPLQIVLSVYFLWLAFGPASLAGFSILILLIPITTIMAYRMKKLQIEQMINKDQRIKRMNEILSGIKVLKLYAWEPSFLEEIYQIREKELIVLRKIKIINCINTLVGTLAPFLVSLSSFATYVLMDEKHVLDARKAFVGITLFNIMRMPMGILPMVMVYFVEAGVSLKRLNNFMNADEIDEEAVTHEKTSDGTVVSVKNGSFTWGDGLALRNINLEIKKGSLVAIVGSVGSGKSSLLSAILGEMEKLSGEVNTVGQIAYVAQTAWIQNKSLRENVLFQKDYDSALYKKVVDVSALNPDFQVLPAGDQTEIGEKGINLSGGQKQRVSLARAAYCDADLYLLDDPLYAVDSHVGKHLFENMIGPQGMLSSKTRVIVTHGITYLPQMDFIIVMTNGEITETGSFSQLLEKRGDFADFLIQHAGVEELEHADKSAVEKMQAAFGDQCDIFAKKLSVVSEIDVGKIGDYDRRKSFMWSSPSKSLKVGKNHSINETETDSLIHNSSLGDTKALTRSNSILSTKGKRGLEKDILIEDERMEVGSVKRDVYSHYLKSVGWDTAIFTFILHVIYSALAVYTNVWLAKWTSEPTVNGGQNIEMRDVFLGVYTALGLGQAVTVFFSNSVMSLGSLQAARYLHDEMLTHILKSPMSFFETTPLGRIVNRFSKDIDVADNTFPENLRAWIACLFQVVSTLIVISFSTPWFLVTILPISFVYYVAQRFYVASSRQMKRLESVSRSPLYSHFSETLTGSVTIRAFSKQAQFIRESEHHVDYNHIAYYPSIIANRWLAIRLETIGNIIIFFAAVFAVTSHSDEASVGLSVSYGLSVTQTLNWLVRMTSEVETNIVAVESIKEYGETPQEADWEIPEKRPPPYWPQNGSIKFTGYQSRYRKGLDLVLKNLSCDIDSGEKIGIVGRTGAGKSSLTLGLFRIVEAAGGSIEIDGRDLSDMGLHDVRGKLTIIPQDPVLFSGTLRFNLDPFGKYSDREIWHALEHAYLKQFVSSMPAGLEFEISEGGENMSVGQRQLVCLARALLRKTKILVLDEATAAVDLETDDLIQQTIRSEFKECTVLTIAHRLNTIMDCNRVMVLDDGVIREFDNPQELLKDQTTLFYSMAKDAGIVYTNQSRRTTISSPKESSIPRSYKNNILWSAM